MRRRAILALCTLSLAGMLSVSAQEGNSSDFRLEKVTLSHSQPDEVLNLLMYSVPGKGSPAGPRNARALAPEGIASIVTLPGERSMLVRGHPVALRQLSAGILVMDAAIEKVAADRSRVVLSLRHADSRLAADLVREFPEAGEITRDEKSLTLEGTPAWLHRALRVAARLEMAAVR